MKKFIIAVIVAVSISVALKGQAYRVFNIDASRFPLMKAQIWAVDSNYNASQLTLKNIQISDNDELKTPIEFKAPGSSILPSSIVLVLDISGSMEGVRFDILKQTVANFLKNLPMELTEVALAAFSDNMYLLCDFTHDRNRLNQSLTKISPGGGTSFNNAFLTEFYGALDISKMGKYKRVVIFLTDGLSSANYNLIVQQAIRDTIQVNCLTVGLPISDELLFIAKETNGNYYSDLNTPNDIQTAFETIYHQIQENTYGYLTWRANPSCNPEKETTITLGGQQFRIQYTIPEELVGSVEVAPSSVTFGEGSPQKTQYRPVFVKGNNIDLHITKVTNTNDSLFGYQKSRIPLITKANQWETVNLTFTPIDSIFTLATYTIQSKNCPDQALFASSTGKKKLLITEPHGGEVFPRGLAIPVQWKGIDPSTPVDLYFQREGETNWTYLSTGAHFHHELKALSLDGQIRLLAQITNNLTFRNLMNAPVTVFSEQGFKSAVFNDGGTEILTQSGSSIIQTWDALTGAIVNNFENTNPGEVAYFARFNRVVNVSKNNITLLTNRNGMFVKDVPLPGKKTWTSFVFIKGKEFYTSAMSYSFTRFWDPTLNFTVNDLPGGKILDAAVTPNTEYIVGREDDRLLVVKVKSSQRWFSIPIAEALQRTVLHHSKNYLVVDQFPTCDLYELDSKKRIASWTKQHFLQFEPSGNHLILQDSLCTSIHSLESGAEEWAFGATDTFQVSKNGEYLAYYAHDSLKVVQLNIQKITDTRKVHQLKQFQFYPQKNYLALLSSDSLMIVDFKTGKILEKVKVEKDLVVDMDVSPTEESIAIVTQKMIALWKPGVPVDSDTSAYFQVVSPKPEVQGLLTFEPQFIHQQVEKVFKKVINNSTPFPITVDSLVIEKSSTAFELVSTHGPIVLEPKQSTSVEIRCCPDRVGEVKGKLLVYSSIHQQEILLQGLGLQPSYVLLNPVVDFGEWKVGEAAHELIPVLMNTGNTELLVSHLEIWPQTTSYSLKNSFAKKTLRPNDTLWVKVQFQPQYRGRQSGILKLDIGTAESVSVTELMGTGLAKRQLVISGRTLHAKTLQPLTAQVVCTELQSKRMICQEDSKTDGTFSLVLATDLNYSLTALLTGYFSSSENLDLVATQTADSLWVQILLTPIETQSRVVLNNIFFESGKAELMAISQNELDRLVSLLILNQGLVIEVHGHTDFVGTGQENLLLSQQRAQTVKKYMEGKGIPGNRIQLRFFGESQPISENETEEGRKANRRVEIIFIRSGAEKH